MLSSGVPGRKSLEVPAGLQYAHVSGLMARHANVVCQSVWEIRRIDNVRIVSLEALSSDLHCQHMRESRPVTIFATDRELGEWRAFKTAISLWDRAGPSAVAENAGWQYRAIEAVVAKLVARRKRPALRLGIERKRSLEEVVIPF